jgi:hypothetical protein
MFKNNQSRREPAPREQSAHQNTQVMRKYMEAMAALRQQPRLVLQEVISRPQTENLPLEQQEFFELSIEESEDIWRPGFISKQTLIQWSEIDRDFMCENPVWERWPTLNKAKEICEEWRKALAAKGFTESDMDF